MHADEQTDAAVGGGAREDRQNREQQAAGQRGGNAGLGGGADRGSVPGRRAGRRTAPWRPPVRGFGPQQARRLAGPSAADPALTDRFCPEPNSPVTGAVPEISRSVELEETI